MLWVSIRTFGTFGYILDDARTFGSGFCRLCIKILACRSGLCFIILGSLQLDSLAQKDWMLAMICRRGRWYVNVSVLAAGSETITQKVRLRLVSKYLVRSMLVAFYTSCCFAFWFSVMCWACGLWLVCIFLKGIWIQHYIYILLAVLYHLLLILLVLPSQGWFVVVGLGLCPPSFACTSFLFNIFYLLKKSLLS